MQIDITDVAGRALPSRVDALHLDSGSYHRTEVPTGTLGWTVPAGNYRAYVHVYDNGVPVLVEVKDLTIPAGGEAFLLVSLLEGDSENLSLRDFDFDGDLAIDRVEIDAGTDPQLAASIPGRPRIVVESPVLEKKERWYRGELFARSDLGIGKESVKDLIKRAEKDKLDFLAIADRNHMKSLDSEDYVSKKLVLIPAMEWGTDERGYALVYGPQTIPDPPSSVPAAQAECIRVQAQGGVFAISEPCLSASPWKWGLSYVNAIEVWHGDWREPPPLGLALLPEDMKQRDSEGLLIHSLAAAAASADLDSISANAQATLFWDYELVRGLMASPIAGSGSSSKKVPMGRPITYIRAKEQSLAGLLDGLRNGHTYVSSGPDGPQLIFHADIANDNTVDVGMGGIIPLNVETTIYAGVKNANGMKLQILENGRPLISKIIEGDPFVHRFVITPTTLAAYRLRIISPAQDTKHGFGRIDVHAMSAPIYAQDITQAAMEYFKVSPDKAWVVLDDENWIDEADLPDPDRVQTKDIDFKPSFGRYAR
ncbi:MAG: hypothetical protein GC168_02980 [Candidatus Hydrogenedens sp.]|nr:hypothetical protein [Candidatus Hydrogenedens sp.]